MSIPRLSAAIIVKNEEAIILRCIENCQKFADEIIIVDTGSTDKTMELAKSVPGVYVYRSMKFNKDTKLADFSFSEAKNEAIRKCTGKWIIWWDADDTIDAESAKKIVELSNSDKKCLWTFSIKYGVSRFDHCRMFLSELGIEFDEDHACHEYLGTKGYPNLANRDIVIEHLPFQGKPCSSTRNVEILRTDYHKRRRRDQRTLFYLANAEMELGNNLDAVKYYDEYLKLSVCNEERCFARYYKAQCLQRLAKNSEAVIEGIRANAEDLRLAEPLCFLGDIFKGLGDYQRALCWYKLASLVPYPKDCVLFIRRDFYENYPLDRIRECESLIKKKDELKRNLVVRLPQDKSLHQVSLSACIFALHSGQVKISILCTDPETARQAIQMGIDLAKPDSSFVEFDFTKQTPQWLCRSVGVVC